MARSTICMLVLLLALTANSRAWATQAAQSTSGAAEENPLRNGSFEDGVKGWASETKADSEAGFTADPTGGREGGPCVVYRKTSPGTVNQRLSQEFTALSNQTYVFGAWVEGDGALRPYLRVTGKDFKELGGTAAPASKEWTVVKGVFESGDQTQFKFQWFGGSHGRPNQGFPGEARMTGAFVRPLSQEEAREGQSATIRVNAVKRVQKINPLLFGMNTLYQIEDDAALKDGRIAQLLKEAACPLLRFPGGGVADNWNWKTQTLDRPDRWPFRAGPETTDTDEFMRFCRAVGAEPIFVCNFAKAIVGPGIEEAARNAAEWVAYCNKTKGYNVKYWEIGNETYLGGAYSCTVASKYAEGLIQFSRAMKAVDPSIQVGANGPDPAAAPGKLDTVPWWPAVFEKALDDIDFVIMHTYFNVSDFRAYQHGDRNFAYDPLTVREFLREHYPRRADMPIALTEWNVKRRSNLDNSLGHAIVVANILGEFARGGIDMATFWPLRYAEKTTDALTMKPFLKERGMLTRDGRAPTPVYYVFKAFGTLCRGALVETACEGTASVYAALADDGKSLNLFVVNPQTRPVECRVSIEGFAPSPEATLQVLTGPSLEANNMKDPATVTLKPVALKAGGDFALEAPGPSLCVAELKAR